MATGANRTQWRTAADNLAAQDAQCAGLYLRHGPPDIGPGARASDRFEALATSIAYQQLAGPAAAAIWGRVLAAVGSPFTPRAVLSTPPDLLRGAGLSAAKSASLLDLAVKVTDGVVRLDRIARLSDHQIVEHLTAVRGIGPWTAQMFLLFDLRRLDVWPTGDHGVRAGFAKAFSLEEAPTERQLMALGAPFAPWRSVLAWWCWREVDTVTPNPR